MCVIVVFVCCNCWCFLFFLCVIVGVSCFFFCVFVGVCWCLCCVVFFLVHLAVFPALVGVACSIMVVVKTKATFL